MIMYRIKCSNGKYVQKTTYGIFIEYSKNGKVFHNINITNKNLYLCQDFAEQTQRDEFKNLTYELEIIK